MKELLNLYRAVGEFLNTPIGDVVPTGAFDRVVEAYDAAYLPYDGIECNIGDDPGTPGPVGFDPRESGSYDPVDDGFAYPVEDTHDIGGEG